MRSRAMSSQRCRCGSPGMSSFTFWSVRWMSSGSPDSAAQRNGPTPRQNSGRTYAARSRGTRRHPARLRRARPGGCCCRSRTPGCRASGTRAWPRRAWPSNGVRRLDRARIALAQAVPLLERPAGRQVAVHGIVRRRLVGDGIGSHAAAQQLRQHLGRVAEQAHGDGLAIARCPFDQRQCLVERAGAHVEVARVEPLLDALRAALDRQHRGAGHRRGEWLRAAHAAETGGEDPASGEIAAVVLAAHFDERLIRALHDALAADVDPRAGRHLPYIIRPLRSSSWK